MNEKIKEFTYLCTNVNDSKGTFQEFDSERFARLIAADIAEFCSNIDGGENMFSRAIRKEYGVEE